MNEKRSGMKSPITLRHVLTTAAVLLLFALVFAVPAAANVMDENWENCNTCSKDNPHIITTTAELNKIRTHIDTTENAITGYFQLGNDIVFETSDFAEGGDYYREGAGWLPIGHNGQGGQYGSHNGIYFVGSFDGNSFAVSGLYTYYESNYSKYNGLFAMLGGDAHIFDLTLKDFNMKADVSGALAGMVNSDSALIENITVDNCTMEHINDTSNASGLLVGKLQGTSTVQNIVIKNSTYGSNNEIKQGWIAGLIQGTKVKNVMITGCTLEGIHSSGLLAETIRNGAELDTITITDSTYIHTYHDENSFIANEVSADVKLSDITMNLKVTGKQTETYTNSVTRIKAEKSLFGTANVLPQMKNVNINIAFDMTDAEKGTQENGSLKMRVENNVIYVIEATNQLNKIKSNGNEILAYTNGGTFNENNELVKTGHTFAGWYVNSDFSGNAVTDLTDSSSPVYAKWTVNTYTLYWQYDNKTTYKEEQIQYGDPITEPEPPQKDSTPQYSYTFKKWDTEIPKTMPANDVTIAAQFNDIINTYTVTWANETQTIETDENVPYGTKPTYDSTVPTKGDDGTNWYVFDKWDKEIVPVTGDITYTAQFTAVPIQSADDTSEEPLFPLGVMTNDNTGETSLAAAGDNTFTIQQDGQTAELEDERGVVTLVIKFNGNIGQPGDTLTTLSGVINEITAEYSETSLVSAEGVGTVKSLVNLALLDTILKNIDALSEIQDELQQGVITKVKDKYPNINPSAMVAVDDSIDNYLETGNSVELTFLFNRTWADANIAAGKLWWFHLHGNNAPVFTQIKATDLQNADTENYRLHLSVSGFSTYGLATGELTTNQQGGGGNGNGGSSTPQGSSVWLQEPLTPTPTETAQPTPTDVAPTDVPTTQPTPTQTESPGFGVLAVLAGLGAVAVLRRK